MTNDTDLARRWIVDIDTAYPAATPTWEQMPGLVEFKPMVTPTEQRDSKYSSDGAIGYTRTAHEWGFETKVSKEKDDTTHAPDPVHAYLKARAYVRYGKGSVTHFRVYDRWGAEDGWEGYALNSWLPDGGDDEQLERVAVNLKPSAVNPVLTAIPNPINATPVPVITSLDPATGPAAGGTLVKITGQHFTGTVSVEFGVGNAATDFDVISDSVISAISPAVAASTVNVEVTNGNGTNADTAADDYEYV